MKSIETVQKHFQFNFWIDFIFR